MASVTAPAISGAGPGHPSCPRDLARALLVPTMAVSAAPMRSEWTQKIFQPAADAVACDGSVAGAADQAGDDQHGGIDQYHHDARGGADLQDVGEGGPMETMRRPSASVCRAALQIGRRIHRAAMA